MPELPEVETTVRDLRKKVIGKTIQKVWTDYNSSYKHYTEQIKNPSYFKKFKRAVLGAKITGVERIGKNILIHLSNGDAILIHMKMTGHLLYGVYRKAENSKSETLNPKQSQNSKIKLQKLPEKWGKEIWIPDESQNSPLWDSYNRHIHLVFSLSGGKKLVLSDARRFARVKLVTKDEVVESKELKDLGPNPLEISKKEFREGLHSRQSGKIKQVLMDQSVLAGIGNIYSDEALWKASIHPASSLKKIPDKKLNELYTAVKSVLKKGIKFGGDSTSDYRTPDGKKGSFQHKHNVYRKKDKKCSKKGCSGVVKRSMVGGRSAHFCDKHQKKY